MAQPFSINDSNWPFNELTTIDSTNNYAREKIRARMAAHGEAFFAHEQTAGRGRNHKAWYTGKDTNIALSICLKPFPLQVADQFQLIAAVAVACHRFFEKYAGDETKIKWPNDIFWRDRKAGGILIESIIGSSETGQSNSWQWGIIGVGLNINTGHFAANTGRPVSLLQITGKKWNTVALAQELHRHIMQAFDELLQTGFEPLLAAYNAALFKKGETVTLQKDELRITTRLQGVDKKGQLLTSDALAAAFAIGEVVWVWE